MNARVALIAVTLITAACGQAASVVGNWSAGSKRIAFTSSGSFEAGAASGQYNISGDSITFVAGGKSISCGYALSGDGKQLEIKPQAGQSTCYLGSYASVQGIYSKQ